MATKPKSEKGKAVKVVEFILQSLQTVLPLIALWPRRKGPRS